MSNDDFVQQEEVLKDPATKELFDALKKCHNEANKQKCNDALEVLNTMLGDDRITAGRALDTFVNAYFDSIATDLAFVLSMASEEGAITVLHAVVQRAWDRRDEQMNKELVNTLLYGDPAFGEQKH